MCLRRIISGRPRSWQRRGYSSGGACRGSKKRRAALHMMGNAARCLLCTARLERALAGCRAGPPPGGAAWVATADGRAAPGARRACQQRAVGVARDACPHRQPSISAGCSTTECGARSRARHGQGSVGGTHTDPLRQIIRWMTAGAGDSGGPARMAPKAAARCAASSHSVRRWLQTLATVLTWHSVRVQI